MFRLTTALRTLAHTTTVTQRTIVSRSVRPMAIAMQRSSLHCSARWSAEAGDPPKTHPVLQQLQQHPEIVQQLYEVAMLLQSKDLGTPGQQPSFTQMFKIMKDPEVRDAITKLSQSMTAAGIQLDMSTVAELQNSLMDVAKQQGTGSQDDLEKLFKRWK
ncbi:hypothetical protein BCR43DRAFT_496099 [Syncephalastrum racemosum]|uniref:Uncharacterized protein n=1 Tax=Syncephalastrum racemosum TaxID=13706 RepID=A0A1X2H700_SYNRA|nr:hypothetical protein BCR43DRAFT_496099 [Syncephalastrum racemosum]